LPSWLLCCTALTCSAHLRRGGVLVERQRCCGCPHATEIETQL
jgi:hypothetical protein